ncbi:calcineurin-like phosphoesterase C-terminal domain-containing protein [Teredinibacter turnerae]|uniref:calcineurin-like phosphoesterase C-terminal domain-containing protein n=1 Tax=Teredinibacter turnerae TaxID=2426 RepID=UPI00040E5B9E|nr:calcineurin-like phosphoesterase family protein [Teredinibacter turnerae]
MKFFNYLVLIGLTLTPLSNAENSGNWMQRPAAKLYRATVDLRGSENGPATRPYIEGYVFVDKNENGRKDKGERGLTGVSVSNGYEVVSTDKKGRYQLPAAASGLSDFTVFITQPSGYRVPVNEHNVPQFFYHHRPQGSPPLRFGGLAPTGSQPMEINFPLQKTRRLSAFKIAVSGDPQPYSNNEVGYVRDALANELAQRDDLEFVLIEGDVMGDDLGLFPRFKRLMSAAGIPQYFVAGNHDLDLDATDDSHSFDTFKREWGPTYYSFDYGDVHFVVLDNVRYPCTPQDNADGRRPECANPESKPTYNGVIDAAQMQWLANDLERVDSDTLIVLNMHIPLVSFNVMESPVHQTDNAKALFDLIGNRPAVGLSGHTHTLENFVAGERYAGWKDAVGVAAPPFPLIVTGATSGSWWSGDFDEYNLPMSIQRLGAPRGYLIFEFHGYQFKSKFKAANKPADEQMSVDFLSPSFMSWYNALKSWAEASPESRTVVPPVNINDLPDTRILTHRDLEQGTALTINVWNGSKESQVWVQIDDLEPVEAQRTQAGEGEGRLVTLDPAALKKQMYVFRYAAKSMSGSERSQSFELYNGERAGIADPRPEPGWMWAQSSTHLWSLSIPKDLADGAHLAYITTRDTYGNVYTTTVTFEVADVRPPAYFRSELF